MKFALGALLAALCFASPAAAQPSIGATPAGSVPPSRCPAFPSPPALPDGASVASRSAVQAADAAFEAYSQTAARVAECRRVEAAELLIKVREHEARVLEFNEGVSAFNAAGQAWRAEIEEFNRRSTRR